MYEGQVLDFEWKAHCSSHNFRTSENSTICFTADKVRIYSSQLKLHIYMEQYVVAPRKVLDTLKHLVRN
jgi:hypothetical protein